MDATFGDVCHVDLLLIDIFPCLLLFLDTCTGNRGLPVDADVQFPFLGLVDGSKKTTGRVCYGFQSMLSFCAFQIFLWLNFFMQSY